MDIKEAILTGAMCEDCIYYEYCYFDKDCIAMEFLKNVAKVHDNLVRGNNTNNGDQ